MTNSCKNRESNKITAEYSNEVVIEGNVGNLGNGVLYLTETHNFNNYLDSTLCINGHFIFRLSKRNFQPFMVSIFYSDTAKPFHTKPLIFRNYTLEADSLKFGFAQFYLSGDHTYIIGDNLSKDRLRIFAGKENDVMFQNQFTDFGWIGNLEGVARAEKIEEFKRQIKKYPFSHFLLESIVYAKEQYSKDEVKEIVSLFNDEAQKSDFGLRLKHYINTLIEPGRPFDEIFALNETYQSVPVNITGGKVNILVFWASWCVPCRKEIPFIKKLFSTYSPKGVNITSVSIDDNKNMWELALAKEKMCWPQFLVDSIKKEDIKGIFRFSAIPLIVFIDKNRMEIQRFIGNDEESESKCIQLIEQLLNPPN